MQEINGCSNKVLEVDLSNKTWEIYEVTEEERKLYLGGKGLGYKLIYDRMKAGINPLGEDNILVIMPGVYMGTGAPCSGRFAAVTKSPLTGIMVSASCGGPFGMNLKTAGWDGLILKGKSKRKTYLEITSQGVEFKNAEKLWGKDTHDSQKMLGNTGGALVIGPAGENLVSFANIMSGHRFLGRGGMGAVMGSKNIKAILAIGKDYKIRPINEKLFNKTRKKANQYINRNPQTSIGYRNFGTGANVNPCNTANIMPVNNFKDGQHPDAYKISGEYYKETFDTKYNTCKPCTILCGHKGNIGGKEQSVPEYETIGLLGSNLGIFDPVTIADFGSLCNRLGMDTISAGSTIAWVMEAAEKGLVKSDLKFGSPDGIEDALNDMAVCNGFGDEMAKGVRYLSNKYGGSDFAIHVKGLEMAAYDPRGSVGQGLSYAVANRGACHLEAYLVAQEVFLGLLNPDMTFGKAAYVVFFQNLKEIIDSMQTCIFTEFAYVLEPPLVKYTPKPLLYMMMQFMYPAAIMVIDYSIYRNLWRSITGINIGHFEFIKAGERIFNLIRYMNTREGISRKDDTLPSRLLNEPRASDHKKRTVPLEKMLSSYYRIRKYDKNGFPSEKRLEKLKITVK